jgi:carboxyl-terminal processing protease
MKKYIIIGALAGIGAGALSFSDIGFFEVKKNLEIFASLYKELNTYYVDELDAKDLIEAGTENMLNQLDPYTNFIPEEDMDDYRIQTTGKYAGIGAIIGTKADWVQITEPYEGFPADKAGLRAGDKIISIAGKSVKGLRTDEVSKMLKGRPGTEIQVIYKRLTANGTEAEGTAKIIREEIKIKNVPYYGMITDDIGYIRLGNFTVSAGQEVRSALASLESQHKLKGVVLDLRGNPGGLLDEAINVANVFVDKNTEIVSVRGREITSTYSRKTINEAGDTKIPLAVIADGNSASASEIVAGSLQDLDRAVIIGERTFGKGLVQTTRPLPYNTKLKITTAKYYIPSGRCIQAINYAERDSNGKVTKLPDSLRTAFKTKSGRTVYDGAGIEPDIKAESEIMQNITISLFTKSLFFDYATEYRAKHDKIAPAKTFALTDEEYLDFTKWVAAKEYEYTTRSEKLLDELKTASEKEKYFENIKANYDDMKQKMMHDKQKDLIKQKSQIITFLQEEIASRYYLNTGRSVMQCRTDEDLKKAVSVLNDNNQLQTILGKSK